MVKRLMLVMALVTAGFSGRAQAASLKVMISPSQAVAAGGQWRRVGTSDWFASGATETDIPAGSHQVEFRDIGGWASPAPQSVTLTDTQSYTMSGAYRLGGALCVTLLPPEAAGGGAQWRRTGTTTWLDSGATEDSIATGTQTIEFKSTTGWGAPANQSVRIDASVTTQAVATFSLVQSGVSWGSYLGCSQTTVNAGYGNCVDSRSISVALDKDGNVLACGAAIYGDWAADGYDTSYNFGSDDAYVVKISPAGEHLWSTFLGGSLKDVALGVASDGEGNVYVTGETYSYGWVSGGFNERFNSDANTDPDAFIAKLSPSGQHLWSTYAGGAKQDGGFAIAVNAAGEVCITGQTTSPDWLWGNYNSTLSMDSPTYGLDAFALKLASDGSVQWGNYIGGTSEEFGSAVALDKDGNVFVTGVTQSSGWITKGGYDTSHNGGNDAFVTAFSAAGDLNWATYLGGSSSDWGYGIAVDGWGFTYVTGATSSLGWATGGYDTSYGGSGDGFAARLTSTGGRSWITYLGGTSADAGRAIAVDNDGETCVAGTTASSGWVSGGFNTTSGNSFLARLSFDGGHQWSGFLGGGWTVDALAFDAAHEIAVGGWCTGPSSLITGGYDTTYNGRSRNAFVAMVRPMGTLNVSITPPAAVSAGARWRPLGGTEWLSGVGAPVRLPVGLTDIEFMPMDGWNAPQLANVTITENTESQVFGTYTPNGSSLQVTITPPEAVAAGAQWRRIGSSTWLDSRAIDTSATPGDWLVEFRNTWGWTAPATLPVKVGYQQPFQATAAYVRQTGAVAVTITPPEAVAAGAQWRRVGTSTWLDSGASDPAPWGAATIEFKPLAGGWGTPASCSIFVDPGQTAAVSGVYAAFGDLTVNILPPEAVAAGAQWRRTGTTTWRNSGYTETNLAATAYTIEFKTLTGWNAPANTGVTVLQGRAVAAEGTYVRQTGSLSLTLSPPAAVAEGAQWRRVGQTAWLNSGDVDAALPTGSYTVEFKPTTNWLAPANATYLVNNNLLTTAQGTYSPGGALTVNIAPPEAVAAGAKWRRVGQTSWLNSGATETTLAPGSCSVEFSPAPGWSAPAPMTSVAIVGGQTTTLAATYTPALASLNWSSYLGGSNNDEVRGIGIDASGNIIAAGSTNSSGWVTGPGSRTTLSGYSDGFVVKLSSAGQMVWSTYVGGSSYDSCDALAVDASGGVYVTGETYSSTSWVSGGYDASFGGYTDAFAMKLDATGQHVWSTYLGGGYEDKGAAIAVDATGAAYVAGTTRSPGWTVGGWRTSKPDTVFDDAFAVKLSPTGQHVWSTYLGGGYLEWAYGIAVAKSGLVYVVGDTNSPSWVSGGFNLTQSGGNDGFLVCLNGGGQHVYSSYVGGSNNDWCQAVAVDSAGNVTVAGTTSSSGWLSGGEDATYGGGWDGFVLKIDPAGKPLWGTYLGGAANDKCLGLAVDGSGKLFVTGMTASAGWLSGGPDVFYGGSSSGSVGDAFVARLSAQGRQVWGTYLGGAKDDQGIAIATDGAGNIAVGGYTFSPGWTSGGYDLIFNDLASGNYNDGFIARLQDLLAPNSALSVTLAPPEAVAAGAAWRRAGSTTWRASGELETALQAGPATVEFKPVTGWLTPANLTLTLAELQTLTTATTYVRQPGAIQVTITPPAAVAAGAAWRRVGTSNWFSNGDTEPGLAKGTYPVEFKPIAGWTTPANQDVMVEYAATTQAAADYVRQTGSLKVTIEPVEAVAAGAAWRRTGTTPWLASGQTETGIPTGDVTIEFKPMPYWTTPSTQTVAIANGQTATTNAAYGVTAALCVSIQPAAAVTAGAQWRLVGQTAWCDSDTTQTGLTPDVMVAVEFRVVSGWTQPATVNLTLPTGQGTKLSGTYVRQSGGLTVTIQPPEAVAAGAKWRRAGTLPWLDSGAVEAPLYTGAETVEFKPITGWQAPDNQPVNIINGYTSPVTGTYVGLGSLRVDITPPEAVAAGAQWRRAGTSAWLNSGATESDVPAGAQTVEFKPVTGWNAPASAGVSVAQGATATTAGGAYVRQTGGLSVTILPAEAVAAGAQWRRAGSANWLASGATENGIAVGSCQIEFSALAGWNAPVPAVATITSGTVATQNGTYVRRTGSLSVALSPAAAVTAGAQWRRKGTTAWFNSGASESGVLPGEWTVEFKDLTSAHWLAPASAAVTVNYDQLTTLGASYSPRLVVSAATPLTVAVAPNAAAIFTVSAAGAPTLKYQWKKNGVAISGATAASYKIAACALAHAGVYTCEVRNSYAQAVSPQFTLAVSKSAAVIRYLLGQSTNPAGLDLNGDGKVTSADVIKGLK